MELTIKEAIEQGFTCALSEDGSYFTYLEDAKDDLENNVELFLGSKESFRYSISEGTMKDIIENYISDQDEVNDESGQLYDLISDIDFKKVCELVNSVFAIEYHKVTNIKLIL